MKNELELVENLYVRVKSILENGRAKAFKVVNTVMIESYWNIGREIVEEEQRGENRAEYGKFVVESISKKLTKEFGKGYSKQNLWYMKQFYLTFPILHSVSGELSWTHYRLLMKLKNDDIRNFYMIETIENNWSSRELDRQVSSLLYERIKMSKDPIAVKELSSVGQKVEIASDIIKSPMVFEFLGKGDYTISIESDLESALMNKLQLFLLELGKGFSFVGRQKRINIEGDNYYKETILL